MDKRTIIDPDQFAMQFAKSNYAKGFNEKEVVVEAKKFLLSYLTAYYLIQDFDDTERQNFEQTTDKKFQDMSFEELMNKVIHLNKY
ncbi:hypothetical protein FC26_GL001326 [Paucilactobacillus vaccinostercus DSM 20634]|jgi:hypothetical protein|uniref:Uncharacterized protein n=1 Tax=Paucilactobacillus vaccinostercus DSM 20634 TaxID=1423813 RepID=A0A0R2A4Z3_9LACO|nr:hypothetical protein [Paucilactobacillus vaccinostercus]KRM61759.1 hypothetical protein FC26_GL001326 [Paucilactobacillus vaccinostercus DSM 20634]RRG10010.1 MAG: hypothetical protein DUD32_07405 [Lactobacillus sp.]